MRVYCSYCLLDCLNDGNSFGYYEKIKDFGYYADRVLQSKLLEHVSLIIFKRTVWV